MDKVFHWREQNGVWGEEKKKNRTGKKKSKQTLLCNLVTFPKEKGNGKV